MRFKQRRQGEILKRQRRLLSCCCGQLIFLVKPAVEVACEACDFCGDCFRFFVATVDLASTIVRTHIAYMYKTCTCTHMHNIMRCAKPRCAGRSSTEVCVLQDAEEQEQ